MEEPPQQVPRHTQTSLTRLWRQHDLADSIVKLLPTQSLAVLPTLSKTFERDKFRMLLVAMRASGVAADCTSAMLSTLQTSGRDAGHYHCTWDKGTWAKTKPRWVLRAGPSRLAVEHTWEEYPEPYPTKHYLRATRKGQYDRRKPICVDHNDIGRSCPRGNRRCVRRVRLVFAFEGPNDEWGAGMSFALRGPDSRNSTILKFYNCVMPDGLNIMCSGGGDVRILTTVPTDLISKPGQEKGPLKTVTVDATLDWNSCSACVRTTTDWDGVEVTASCEFERLPVKGMQLAFYGAGDHYVGDIDVWYYDMPAPPVLPARFRLPFVPCRGDDHRTIISACLVEAPFFRSDAPGVPHQPWLYDESPDSDE